MVAFIIIRGSFTFTSFLGGPFCPLLAQQCRAESTCGLQSGGRRRRAELSNFNGHIRATPRGHAATGHKLSMAVGSASAFALSLSLWSLALCSALCLPVLCLCLQHCKPPLSTLLSSTGSTLQRDLFNNGIGFDWNFLKDRRPKIGLKTVSPRTSRRPQVGPRHLSRDFAYASRVAGFRE